VISVLVCSIRVQTLPCTIESLLRQTHSDWELIVADQSQTEEIADYLGTLNNPRIIHLPLDFRGKSRALNAAVEASSGHILAITDDDCEASADWLADIERTFQTEEADILFGPVVAPPGWTRAQGACPTCLISDKHLVTWSDVALGRGNGGIGANMSLRREAIKTLGPFDPLLGPGSPFMPVGEDTDYIYRALSHGLRLLCAPIAPIHHTHGVRPGEQGENLRNLNLIGLGALHEKQILGPYRHIARPYIAALYRLFRREVLANLARGRMRHLGIKRLRLMWRGRTFIRRNFTVNENALLVPISPETCRPVMIRS